MDVDYTGGFVRVTARVKRNTASKTMDSREAHAAVLDVLRGAPGTISYHVFQGCWDPVLRKHRMEPATEEQEPQQFEDLDEQNLLA